MYSPSLLFGRLRGGFRASSRGGGGRGTVQLGAFGVDALLDAALRAAVESLVLGHFSPYQDVGSGL